MAAATRNAQARAMLAGLRQLSGVSQRAQRQPSPSGAGRLMSPHGRHARGCCARRWTVTPQLPFPVPDRARFVGGVRRGEQHHERRRSRTGPPPPARSRCPAASRTRPARPRMKTSVIAQGRNGVHDAERRAQARAARSPAAAAAACRRSRRAPRRETSMAVASTRRRHRGHARRRRARARCRRWSWLAAQSLRVHLHQGEGVREGEHDRCREHEGERVVDAVGLVPVELGAAAHAFRAPVGHERGPRCRESHSGQATRGGGGAIS